MRFLTDRQTASKREKTPEGYLVVKDVKIARTGVQTYAAKEIWDADDMPEKYRGSPLAPVRLARLADDVFSDESKASFQHLPLTNDHPGILVDATNVKKLQVGFSFNDVRRDGIHLVTDLKFTDAQAISDIESGKAEISNGYDADVILMDGMLDGEPFDAVQKQIRGNHIALVKRGRAGSAVRLSDNHNPQGNNPMRVLLIDGINYQFEDQAAEVVQKLQGQVSTLNQKLTDAAGTNSQALTDAQTEVSELKGQLAAEQAKHLTDAQIDDLVSKRAVLLGDAQAVLGKDADLTGKSEIEVKKAVIVKLNDSISLDDQDDAYVNGVYASLVATAKKGSAKSLADALKDAADLNDDDESEFTKRRNQHLADSKDAWKTGGNK